MTRPLLVLALLAAACDGAGGGNTDDLIDQDGDGYFVNDTNAARVDCDDRPQGGNTAFPGGREVCDGLDNDCNGTVDDDDAEGALEWWPDDDRDGFGKRVDEPKLACRIPPGHSANRQDCNDSDAFVYPNAPERCNEKDDNCNLTVDEGFDPSAEWHLDVDRDGFGGVDIVGTGCAQQPSWVTDGTDCNDVNSRIKPGADELCDGVDNDCDTRVDDADTDSTLVGGRRWYNDSDHDTYGNVLVTQVTCRPPTPAADWVADDQDCDDANAAVNPTTVWYPDEDRDGHAVNGTPWPEAQCWQPVGFAYLVDDCDDADPDEWRGKQWFADADRDGYGSPAVVWTGCNHNPLWSDNALDCDDRDDAVNPLAIETCNDGVDDDCDGLPDDEDDIVTGRTLWYADADGDGWGLFSDRVELCDAQPGRAPLYGDCDDADPTRNNGTLWYRDADRDGYGDAHGDAVGPSCAPVAGHVPNDDDCDDDDFFLNGDTLWFTDADGDGVGIGKVPVAQGCEVDDENVAAISGDCDDADPLDDLGGCYPPMQGLIEVQADTDLKPTGTNVTITCAGTPPTSRTFIPGDANKLITVRTPSIAAGTLCSVRSSGAVTDVDNDGYVHFEVFACGQRVASWEHTPPAFDSVQFELPNCAGCTDPLAYNYDPDVLIPTNAQSCIYAP